MVREWLPFKFFQNSIFEQQLWRWSVGLRPFFQVTSNYWTSPKFLAEGIDSNIKPIVSRLLQIVNVKVVVSKDGPLSHTERVVKMI